MNNKGVPGLRKVCIFQIATNDENVNLGVYPESDPELAYPSLFTVKCLFRILDIIRLQKSTMKSSCGRGGGARGAYVAHELLDYCIQIYMNTLLNPLKCMTYKGRT